MNRREFLKSALTIAALAPVTRLAAGAGADGDKTSDAAERRRSPAAVIKQVR